MSARTYYESPFIYSLPFKEDNTNVEGLDGPIKVTGSVEVPVKIGKLEYKIPFLLTPSMAGSFDLVVGDDMFNRG